MSELTEKQALRQELRRRRRAYKNDTADAAILRRLLSFEALQRSDLVLTYVSVNAEVDTRALLTHCLTAGKRVAVPRCEADGTMHFYEIRSFDELLPSAFGIPEPDGLTPPVGATAHTICVVPGLSFDADGFRLGYGGGYYDRYLSTFPGVTVGLCYDVLLSERLPRESFDCRVEHIITETQHLML